MGRPNGKDEAVILDAAKHALEDFRDWVRDSSWSDDELLTHLCDAIRYEDDGYARAKHLERSGYTPDSALVELLDGVDVWAAERRAVAEWVKKFEVKPPYPIGTVVQIEDTTGEITKNDEILAQSTVCIASRGHVKEGVGTHGQLVAWEKLKPIQQPTVVG